ncbi:MAG: L-threonylcarbamoyladenylate synthase [Gilvibacter sp.]
MNQEISNALEVLKKGGLIVYPTDTIWGIGCDATNYEAVERVYALKKRADSKAMICLVSNFRMLEQFIEAVPEVAFDILKYSSKPTTIVYDKPVHVATNLVAKDDTLAVRVVNDPFCQKLVSYFKKPIVSTSANISGTPAPNSFQQIPKEILEGVDYVVNLHRTKKSAKASSIIKLSADGQVRVIRQ